MSVSVSIKLLTQIFEIVKSLEKREDNLQKYFQKFQYFFSFPKAWIYVREHWFVVAPVFIGVKAIRGSNKLEE